MKQDREDRGFALIGALLVAALVAGLLSAHFVLTRMERATTHSSMSSNRGFYAAEAGLNLRAEQIRETFLGYNRPEGTSPIVIPGTVPCRTGEPGDGDFVCREFNFKGRDVETYVIELPGNPLSIVIPPGELYQNLNAQSYFFEVQSVAVDRETNPEAVLDMEFESRLVPLFQFLAFYDKDLEILPGNFMNLTGPIYSNGNLHLGTENVLTINGQVTVTGDLYHGRKDYDGCQPGTVQIYNPANPMALPGCGGGRRKLRPDELPAWNGAIRAGVEAVTVPEPEAIDAEPGRLYWDKADLRIMLDLNGGSPEIQVRHANGSVDAFATGLLAACDAAKHSLTFHNQREEKDIWMLEIDARELLNCINGNPLLIANRGLDDRTEGGLVWYFGVDGPLADGLNNYGVRLGNGEKLAAESVSAPEIEGLTVVSGQALYVKGDWNALDKKPAALMADSINILSGAWEDTDSMLPLDDARRRATPTDIRAAFLAGTDTTGNVEGSGGLNQGKYNGGLENYPRLHENWGGTRLYYRGSFVSLDRPRHVAGPWSLVNYIPSIRDWGFDSDFNDAANLPPLSPRFVYVKQVLFVREFHL